LPAAHIDDAYADLVEDPDTEIPFAVDPARHTITRRLVDKKTGRVLVYDWWPGGACGTGEDGGGFREWRFDNGTSLGY
jgi:hypothetical protein